jgi:ABC-type glutathione transport system ATPase component
VRFFGELEASKRQEEILPSLQILEPRLHKLSLVPLAGETVIHGDIGLPRLVPVPFMGEGMRRLLTVLLAIANARGGVVLIDEIENGLHYSVQKQVWQAIAHAARQSDVQVFATTHSYECINAAHEAFASSEPYDFTLHRLDRVNDTIEAVRYDRDTMEYALEMSHEVR